MLIGVQTSPKVLHFIPTSEVVRVASMAARDEGYHPEKESTYLDELRTASGKEPIDGYTSIGLYVNDDLVRSYSIRIETGDIVDATACKILRYPNLILFKKEVMKSFNSRPASLGEIATEIGCEKLEFVPAGHKE